MTSPTVETKTEAKKFNIFVNDTKYTVDETDMTGLQLKALADIPVANQLFLEVPGPEDDDPVRDNEDLHLKSGMKFYDVPVGNLGAC